MAPVPAAVWGRAACAWQQRAAGAWGHVFEWRWEKKAGNQSCWKHPACASGDLPGHQPICKSCGRLAGNCGVISLVVDSSSNKRVPWRKQMAFASRRPLPWPGSSRSVPAAKAISAMALLSPGGSAAQCSAGPCRRTAGAAGAYRLLGGGFHAEASRGFAGVLHRYHVDLQGCCTGVMRICVGVAQVLRGFAGVLHRFETCAAAGAASGLFPGALGSRQVMNHCQRLFPQPLQAARVSCRSAGRSQGCKAHPGDRGDTGTAVSAPVCAGQSQGRENPDP